MIKRHIISFYHRIVWNMIIRTLLELFYPTVLAAFVAAYLNSHESKKLGKPVITIIFFFAFMIFTFFFMRRNKDNIDTEAFKTRYGAYMTNIETYKKPSAAHYPFFFMLRRFLIAIMIGCMRKNIVG